MHKVRKAIEVRGGATAHLFTAAPCLLILGPLHLPICVAGVAIVRTPTIHMRATPIFLFFRPTLLPIREASLAIILGIGLGETRWKPCLLLRWCCNTWRCGNQRRCGCARAISIGKSAVTAHGAIPENVTVGRRTCIWFSQIPMTGSPLDTKLACSTVAFEMAFFVTTLRASMACVIAAPGLLCFRPFACQTGFPLQAIKQRRGCYRCRCYRRQCSCDRPFGCTE